MGFAIFVLLVSTAVLASNIATYRAIKKNFDTLAARDKAQRESDELRGITRYYKGKRI